MQTVLALALAPLLGSHLGTCAQHAGTQSGSKPSKAL